MDDPELQGHLLQKGRRKGDSIQDSETTIDMPSKVLSSMPVDVNPFLLHPYSTDETSEIPSEHISNGAISSDMF